MDIHRAAVGEPTRRLRLKDVRARRFDCKSDYVGARLIACGATVKGMRNGGFPPPNVIAVA